jgi:hypothetical protein
MRSCLLDMGYNDDVINDEIQAYLATGFTFKEYVQEDYIPKAIIEEFEGKFKEVFLKHKALVKIEKEFVCDL